MRYLAAISLAVLCGCLINSDTQYYAKAKPDQQEMVGKYVPRPDTLTWIRDEGKYPAVETSLLLAEDGSFQMSHMPDWWNTSFGEPEGGFDSGDGQWDLVKHQGWWELELHFQSRKDFASNPGDAGHLTSIPIAGQAAPYKLWFIVGDPDEGDVMILEKEQAGS